MFDSLGRVDLIERTGQRRGETSRILGAHLRGGGAEEVINLFAVAMRSGMPATDLKQMTFAYPTYGSNLPSMLQESSTFRRHIADFWTTQEQGLER